MSLNVKNSVFILEYTKWLQQSILQ